MVKGVGRSNNAPENGGFETGKRPVTIDGATGKPMPTPPAKKRPRHIRLRTIDDVRLEAERVYRDARNGKIQPGDATKFSYMLAQIGSLIELGEFERRLGAVEAKALEERSDGKT